MTGTARLTTRATLIEALFDPGALGVKLTDSSTVPLFSTVPADGE